MSTLIGGSSFARTFRAAQDSQARTEPEPSLEAESQTVETAPDIQAQMAEVEDDAGDMMAQFGRFRSAQRKARRSEDFERILDSDAEEKLDELAQMFKGAKGDRTSLMREGRQRFGDDSDLMLALRELRRRKKLDGDPVDVVEKAIDEMLKEGDQKQIKAGINAALKAKVFGKRLQLDPARLRQLYRQFLEFEGAYLVVYEHWIEEFGPRKRKRIMEYVNAALTYDMQSLDPSCGCAAEFGPLLSMLGNLRMLSSADELFVGRMLDDPMSGGEWLTEECLLKLMLDGIQRPLEIEKVLMEVLGPILSLLEPKTRSELMQLVLRGFAGIPIALYGEVAARHIVIETLQEMLGAFYARERRRALRKATSGTK